MDKFARTIKPYKNVRTASNVPNFPNSEYKFEVDTNEFQEEEKSNQTYSKNLYTDVKKEGDHSMNSISRAKTSMKERKKDFTDFHNIPKELDYVSSSQKEKKPLTSRKK
jgi:hypothetical protein